MAGSYNRGYVKRAAIAGTAELTALVPVAAESKFLSLNTNTNTVTQSKDLGIGDLTDILALPDGSFFVSNGSSLLTEVSTFLK